MNQNSNSEIQGQKRTENTPLSTSTKIQSTIPDQIRSLFKTYTLSKEIETTFTWNNGSSDTHPTLVMGTKIDARANSGSLLKRSQLTDMFYALGYDNLGDLHDTYDQVDQGQKIMTWTDMGFAHYPHVCMLHRNALNIHSDDENLFDISLSCGEINAKDISITTSNTEIDKLFQSLEQASGIRGIMTPNIYFLWRENITSAKPILGKEMALRKIPRKHSSTTHNTFLKNGWVVNDRMLSDGTIVGGEGFQKDTLRCSLVLSSFDGYHDLLKNPKSPESLALQKIIEEVGNNPNKEIPNLTSEEFIRCGEWK